VLSNLLNSDLTINSNTRALNTLKKKHSTEKDLMFDCMYRAFEFIDLLTLANES
jgi:hypothetical protein